MPKEGQLHPTFPAFQRWVIHKLVGIFATDDTNVLPYIVMRWIEQNGDELKAYGITFDEWRKTQGGPQGIVKALQEHSPSHENAERDSSPRRG
jgi:hypothetical protein